MGFNWRGKVQRNQPVNGLAVSAGSGESPVEGGIPAGQGHYVPAPFMHPYTGNLVRLPPGTLNPLFGMFGSKVLGFQKQNPFTPYAAQPQAMTGVPLTSLSNGYVYPATQFTTTPLADFSSAASSDSTATE